VSIAASVVSEPDLSREGSGSETTASVIRKLLVNFWIREKQITGFSPIVFCYLSGRFKTRQAVEKVVCTPGNYGGGRAFWKAVRSKWGPALLQCSHLKFWKLHGHSWS